MEVIHRHDHLVEGSTWVIRKIFSWRLRIAMEDLYLITEWKAWRTTATNSESGWSKLINLVSPVLDVGNEVGGVGVVDALGHVIKVVEKRVQF